MPDGRVPIARPRSAAVAASGPDADTDDEPLWSPLTVAIAGIGVAVLALMLSSGTTPLVTATLLVAVLSVLALLNPRAAAFLTICFLVVLGDVRRLASAGFSPGSDPIVLVAPVVVLVLTLIAMFKNRLTRRTLIGRQVFIVLVIMGIQSMNPRQGGPMVGLTGILCVMIPMCWFWIGQSWGSAQFTERVLYRAVVPMAIAAAAMGLIQVFVGRPAYQEAWIHWFYGKAPSPDLARPFGFFSSVSEFAKYLAIGIVLLFASLIAGRARLMLLLGLPALALSLFLASARGPVVLICAVLVLLWAMRSRGKMWIPQVALAAVFVVGGLVWTMNEVRDMNVAPEMEYLVKHQTEGILNPFDEQKSSAVGHAGALTTGLLSGLRDPVGIGLGCVTHVSATYGGVVAGTEVDVSNMFIALGIVGGIAYLALYYKVYVAFFRYWRSTRSPVALGLAAVILVISGSWLNTGEYSTISLVWFCIGALDKQWASVERQLR